MFPSGLDWCALTTFIVSYHSDDGPSGSFVGAGEFSLLGGGDLHILDVRLSHVVFADGYGAVFKVISLGKYPYVPRCPLFDEAAHS